MNDIAMTGLILEFADKAIKTSNIEEMQNSDLYHLMALAAALARLDADDAVEDTMQGVDPEGYSEDELHPRVQDVITAACGALITNEGQANFTAIKRLKELGWRVTRGEHDSFGWLSGTIHTRKGSIMYG